MGFNQLALALCDSPLRIRPLDEAVVDQPLDGPPPHAGVVEDEPLLPKLRVVVQLVLEPPERARPAERPLESRRHPLVAHSRNEVLHVGVRLVRRDRVDGHEAGLVEVVHVPLVYARGMEPHLPRAGIEPPGVLVGVVFERGGEVVEVEVVKVEHELLLAATEPVQERGQPTGPVPAVTRSHSSKTPQE